METMMTSKIGKKTVSSTGLTLLELLVVVLIMGLLVLLGLPTLLKFGSNVRLKNATHQVASLLRLARDLATTRNITCTVYIYPSDMGTDTANKIYVEGSGAQVEKIWIAPPLIETPDVSGSSGSVVTIQFTSYGTSDAKSIHIIQKGTLIDGSSYSPTGIYSGLSKAERVKCHTVTTDNNTGRSQIYYYGRNDPWSPNDL